MNHEWLIALPVWGRRCVDAFCNFTVPALKVALEGRRVRFVVHTDEPDVAHRELAGFERLVFPVPEVGAKHQYHAPVAAANRHAIALAHEGEVVSFINADIAVSREAFAAAERRIEQGKRLIMMAALRTYGGAPPVGIPARNLLAWTWKNRHPWVEDCTWGRGKTMVPAMLMFERQGRVNMHAFHLQPFAAVQDARLEFKRDTVDYDLINSVQLDQIHVVTDPDEAAMAESSPLERCFGSRQQLDVRYVAHWARRTIERHRWTFRHPITIVGDGTDIGNRIVCNAILTRVNGGRRPVGNFVPVK